MNTPEQCKALSLLSEIWSLSPDVRLGQLMAHLGFMGDNYFERGLGDIEDNELIEVMRRHRQELHDRTPDPAADPVSDIR